jgi:hypothetical protein
MKVTHNMGHVDALSRRTIGALAVLAGITSLKGFVHGFPLLTWLVLVLMFVTGLFFLEGGWRGGTGIRGGFTMLLAGVDAFLAIKGWGVWALVIGLIVAIDAFSTAQIGWSPFNALVHRDTHEADHEWELHGPAH